MLDSSKNKKQTEVKEVDVRSDPGLSDCESVASRKSKLAESSRGKLDTGNVGASSGKVAPEIPPGTVSKLTGLKKRIAERPAGIPHYLVMSDQSDESESDDEEEAPKSKKQRKN